MNQNVTIPSPLNAGDVLTITVAGADPTITGVSISGPTTVLEGATAQFTDVVTGTGPFDPSVTWSCDDGTISPSGLFTAPLKQEGVNIKATSVADPTKFAVYPISIALPSNTVKLAPSGGDDTAAVQTNWNNAAAAGKILELLVGTWHLNPITKPVNGVLLVDPGCLVTDQSVYGTNAVMINVSTPGGSITATGAFFQMPLNHAQSLIDKSEYRHCIAIGQSGAVSNFTLNGFNAKSSGGDCLYVRNCSNVSISNVTVTSAIRNGISVTGKVNGLTFNNITSTNNADGDFDIEPNVNTDALQTVVINNLTTGGTNGGINFGLQNLDSTTPPVSIVVNGYTSTGNGGTSGPGYPIFFDSNQAGKTPVGGTVVVNGINISNSPSAAIYGKNQGGNGLCQFTFNNITTSNTNTGGADRYGVSAVVGVELYGGQPGPAGNAIFNVSRIQAGAKSTAYFQIANGLPNTQFNGSPSICTGAPSGCPTKYP